MLTLRQRVKTDNEERAQEVSHERVSFEAAQQVDFIKHGVHWRIA
jgi:hypothetical protein